MGAKVEVLRGMLQEVYEIAVDPGRVKLFALGQLRWQGDVVDKIL